MVYYSPLALNSKDSNLNLSELFLKLEVIMCVFTCLCLITDPADMLLKYWLFGSSLSTFVEREELMGGA